LTDPPATTVLEMLFGSGTIEYVVGGETVVIGVQAGSTASVTETYTNGTLTGLTVTQPTGDPGGVTVDDEPVGSASLAGKLDLSSTRLALNAKLTLGSGSAISLPEQVVLDVGAYSATIPASSLKKNKQGYAFTRTVSGVALSGLISKVSPTVYQVQILGTGPNNAGSTNPITVGVRIGDDAGVAVVKAKIT
jgi:hypothetical protein